MSPYKPLLFVVMPFGQKNDPTGTYTIDFDRIYEGAIKPAAEAANLEVIRADEERTGGIIHVPMFERLLLAELVVADLTTLNANVFYELGVRHSAKPRTTVLMFARVSQLPFDVSMIRAVPYDLEHGVLSEPTRVELQHLLTERLNDAQNNLAGTDSPLFQLIQDFPGIDLPPDVTQSFRERAYYIEDLRSRLEKARQLEERDPAGALTAVEAIETSLGDLGHAPSELLVDLLLSYRDVRGIEQMIRLIRSLPAGPVTEAVKIREAYAFALNRRNQPGDRSEATRVLENVIKSHGVSSETCGLLGRIFKDGYLEEWTKATPNPAVVAAYLEKSTTWYRRGFEADPRDYYPGINLATLLFARGDPASLTELQVVLPTVTFALNRRGGMASQDYWDVATALEAAVLAERWEEAQQAVGCLLTLGAPSWNRESTVRNLDIIRRVRLERRISTAELDSLRAQVAPARAEGKAE